MCDWGHSNGHSNLCIDEINKFFRCNPQLKSYSQGDELRNIGDDASIFQVLATYAPQIEKVEIKQLGQVYRKYLKYLNQLSALKSLSLRAYDHYEFPINGIDFANIPIEHLSFDDMDFREDPIGISELKNLKRLHLSYIQGLTAINIVDYYKRCSELSELHMCQIFRLELKVNNFLEMLRNAEKLQKITFLQYDGECDDDVDYDGNNHQIIDVATYEKMVDMVKYRPHKTYLEIESKYYDEPQIPEELIKSHENSFELRINSKTV